MDEVHLAVTDGIPGLGVGQQRAADLLLDDYLALAQLFDGDAELMILHTGHAGGGQAVGQNELLVADIVQVVAGAGGCGGVAVGGAGIGGLVLGGLAAAAGGQRQNHGKRKDETQYFLHFFSS